MRRRNKDAVGAAAGQGIMRELIERLLLILLILNSILYSIERFVVVNIS